MWIVAGSAPHFVATDTLASAERQLFGMADDLEGRLVAVRHGVTINSECVLQRLADDKVRKHLAWIQDSCHTLQMALFADAVARGGIQSDRVDDVRRTWVKEMSICRAMTSAAANREVQERLRPILIDCSGNRSERTSVTEDTSRLDGAGEVGVRFGFVAGCETVCRFAPVVCNGRLK